MWILAALPLTALSITKKNLNGYLKGSFLVIAVYSLGLIAQMVMHVHYTQAAFDYYIGWRGGSSAAWPLLDPNNAACIVNIGLIASFYKGLRNHKWLVAWGYFILALVATASRAGALIAALMCLVMLIEHYGRKAILLLPFFVVPVIRYHEILLNAFASRLPIWQGSLNLLFIRPMTGLGLGTFSTYYHQVRVENVTGGWYAHNDLLQIAIEMGIPAVTVLCGLLIIAFAGWKVAVLPVCILGAIFLHSLVEFDFYVPAISLLGGVALGWHNVEAKA